MMGHREQLKTGAEWDLICGWRKVMCYMHRPGVARSIKNQINRRSRRDSRRRLADESTSS
jgi:hypothetical protein